MTAINRATLLALGAVACWSTVATAFKLSLQFIEPAQLLLVSALTATFSLTLVLALRGVGRPGLAQLWPSLWQGMLNPFAYYLVLFAAYARLPAQEAQALNYLWALTLSWLAVPLLGQVLRRVDVLSGLICYLGVFVIAVRGNLLSLEFHDPVGVGLALFSTLIWALYWIAARRDRRDPVLAVTLNFAVGMVLIAAWCGLHGLLRPLPTAGLAGAVYIGLVEMTLGFLLWGAAMRATPSTARIANLIFISPFLSLIFIGAFVGEAIMASTVVGLALIVLGLVLQSRPGGNAGPG